LTNKPARAELDRAVDLAIARDRGWEPAYESAALDLHSVTRAIARLERIELSLEERALHDEWARPRKFVGGAPDPGAPSPILLLLGRLESARDELRYEAARKAHGAPCDCAALIELGRHDKKPDSPAFHVIKVIDALYASEWRCDACGTRWSETRDCDDVGVWSNWHATK